MSGPKAVVFGMLSVWLCGGVIPSLASAESAAPVRQAAGEIIWLDTQLGKLQLYTDRARGASATEEYNITEHETRVTDRRDRQFLAIKDLRAGQHITVESRASGENDLATQITVEPTAAPLFQQAEGTIESIDVSNPGTLVLNETAGSPAAGTVSVFAFDPQSIVVMEHPSLQPVRLNVQPGDVVRIEYVLRDGRRYARSMMRYAPAPGSSTTITTTTRTTTTTP